MSYTHFNKETLVWSGIDRPLYNGHTDKILGQSLLNALNKPERVIQINDNNGYQMTNLEMYHKSIAVAKNLNTLGYNQKTVIGICSQNNHFLPPIVLGCIINGVPMNPIDPNYRTAEIVQMFGLTKPSAIFCERNKVTEMKNALNILKVDIPIYVFHEKIDGCLLAEELFNGTGDDDGNFVASAVKDPDNEICIIICSSGTTGPSKGVSLSYSSFTKTNPGQDIFNLIFKGTFMHIGTINWVGTFNVLLGCILYESLRIITTETFSPQLALKLIPKYKVGITTMPPIWLALILSHSAIETTDISTLKLNVIVGANLNEDLVEWFHKYAPNANVFTCYGLSESNTPITKNFPNGRLGSVGQMFDGVQVKIIDNNLEKCGVNVEGEIWFNSTKKMLGYYGMEEKTKQMYDNDGFMCTGDIGYFDEDGYLYVIDRKKDVFRHRCSLIQPTVLEQFIQKHDGVQLVCVVGIPDMFESFLPAAAIVKSGNVCDDTIKNDINKMMKESFKDDSQLLGGIYFFESLPLTSSGKFIRHEIKNIVTKIYESNKSTIQLGIGG